MADEKDEAEGTTDDAAASSPKKKKLMLFGGGGLGVVAAAFVAATLAAPAKKEYKVFEGPWITPLTPEKVQVNLNGEGRKRFLVFTAEAYFEAYEEGYATARAADPTYLALMKDVALRVASRRTADEINSEVGNAAFREDLRLAIDPLLFPVQLGKTAGPTEQDPRSGLKLGTSSIRSNFRVPLYDGVLHVDAPARTLRLGRGQPVAFEGPDKDVRVEDENGRFVFIDVSRIEEDFQGEVLVGVHGRIRKVLLTDWAIQ
jgi:flagellar basal body-associated protein FliL